MKKNIICSLILILIVHQVHGQYSRWVHWGEAVPGYSLGPVRTVVVDDQVECFGFWGSVLNGPQEQGLYKNRLDLQTGLVVEETSSPSLLPSAIGGGANPENCYHKLFGSRYLGVWGRGGVFQYPYLIMCNENLDTLWTREIIDFYQDTLVTVDETPCGVLPTVENEFLLLNQVKYASDPSLNGIRFVRMNYDGEILSDSIWHKSDNNLPAWNYGLSMERMELLGQDSLLIYGQFGDLSVPGFPNAQLFVAKTDFYGHMDIYKEFNENSPCIEASWAGLTNENNQFIVVGPDCDSLIDNDQTIIAAKVRLRVLNASTLLEDYTTLLDFGSAITGPFWIFEFGDLIEIPQGGYFGYASFMLSPIYEQRWLVYKITSDFQLDWYVYQDWSSQPAVLAINSIAATPDGGFVVGGYRQDALNLPFVQYAFKTDGCGYTVPFNCAEIADVEAEASVKSSVVVWPNPIQNTCSVILPNSTDEVRLIDIMGRVVFAQKVYYPKQEFNFSDLPSATYMLQALAGGSVCGNAKIVVE